ncbi:putative ADP-ribosylation factor-like protein 5C [Moschus berezovskii]|uniref:putative ADP-ribosylation factor-like protein 5C n=1 Tax=Moschus berezovskii TaxID=68408 RepID=UPI002444FDF4|nr:putative ADP-ribosylation factor-like protein 5C [Moschus berezovskii]
MVPSWGQRPRGFPGPLGDRLAGLRRPHRQSLLEPSPEGGAPSTWARPGPLKSPRVLALSDSGRAMGQLMAKLMSIFREREHKVIIVGLDNAGKTTILYQFLTNEVVHTCPTIGSNVEEIVLQKTHFLMWDIGGQEALRSTWNTYYSSTEFIILVIDSTDRDRLLTTREELYKMLAHEALRDASILIFANKQDIKDSMTIVEISQFLTLSAIKDHPWHIQGCCALTGEGLPAGLQWMQSQATAN